MAIFMLELVFTVLWVTTELAFKATLVIMSWLLGQLFALVAKAFA
jgi:hypothetical protein